MRWHACLMFFLTSPLALAAGGSALSLDEAVMRAVDGAPQVTARAAGASAMRELADSAGRLPDPSLTIGVDNLPVEGPDAWSTTTDSMTMRTIGLRQEFPRGEKRRLERVRAEADVSLAEAELAATGLDTARETARAWIRCAALESALADLRALRPDVALGAVAARAAVAAGTTSAAEALAAEAEIARLDNRIAELEAEAHYARIELARWIGDEAERPLAPAPDFGRLLAPESALIADAGRHAAIQSIAARVDAARTDVDLARADKHPDWSAELSFGKRGPDFSDMASLEFSIGLPLFAKHRQDPVIASRTAELRQLEAERETALRAHTAELRKTLLEWELAGTRLERYDRVLLPLAHERAVTALAAYRAGRGSFQLALDARKDQVELAVERALTVDARGRAWAFLRYLDPRQLQGAEEELP